MLVFRNVPTSVKIGPQKLQKRRISCFDKLDVLPKGLKTYSKSWHLLCKRRKKYIAFLSQKFCPTLNFLKSGSRIKIRTRIQQKAWIRIPVQLRWIRSTDTYRYGLTPIPVAVNILAEKDDLFHSCSWQFPEPGASSGPLVFWIRSFCHIRIGLSLTWKFTKKC